MEDEKPTPESQPSDAAPAPTQPEPLPTRPDPLLVSAKEFSEDRPDRQRSLTGEGTPRGGGDDE
jgi:hypothetical protein